MRITRGTLALAALVVVLGFGWDALRTGGREVAVLRTFDPEGDDRFTSLWVVDDGAGFVWLRAERADRKWLAHLRRNPGVRLHRGEDSRRYRAEIFDDPATRAYVAPRFREKYGLADRWRSWTERQDPTPVRLQPL